MGAILRGCNPTVTIYDNPHLADKTSKFARHVGSCKALQVGIKVSSIDK